MRKNQRDRREIRVPISTQWTRVSEVITLGEGDPDMSYVLAIRSDGGAIDLDAVAVTPASLGLSERYVAYRPAEVFAEAVNLPGYLANGNLLEEGFEAEMVAWVHNPSDKSLSGELKWELLDYLGEPVVGSDTSMELVSLKPGETRRFSRRFPLNHKGLLLARASVLGAGQAVIDSSRVPLTVLPFPKAATEPNPNERIGASFRGPHTMKLGQRIGFRWTRWYPHINWKKVQPNNADSWDWPDEVVDQLVAHGVSINAVLFALPDWAQAGSDKTRMTDMDWPEGDPRWQDLSIDTRWDRFVRAAVKRYQDQPVVWEFVNEPENPGYPRWEPWYYTALAGRTSVVMKDANPDAFFLTNQLEPKLSPLVKDFAKRGGGELIDAHSWHNYGARGMGGARTIRRIERLFASAGAPDIEVWFNEGGAFGNSAQDYPAFELGTVDHAEWAHVTTRSMAEMLSAGADKHILFHIGYEKNPRSWWDWTYNGGVELWDDHGHPTAGPAVWNVIIDSLGWSDPVGTIERIGVKVHVFDDHRNRRGVAVIYVDKPKDGEAEALDWALPPDTFIQRDVMGNERLVEQRVRVRSDGTPIYLYHTTKSGGQLLQALKDVSE
ncbi:MAG: hypothetical protein AAF711_01995 [Planctomycetota bacterium]